MYKSIEFINYETKTTLGLYIIALNLISINCVFIFYKYNSVEEKFLMTFPVAYVIFRNIAYS